MKKQILLVIALAGYCCGAVAQNVSPIVQEGTVNTSIDTVWRAWTTSEGLQSWLAPHAAIDLRVGGKMRANYDAAGSLDDGQAIENTILSYEPERMLSIRVSKAPDGFPFADVIQDMWTVVYFEPRGPNATQVRVVSLGFTTEPQSQAMRAFFEQGNADTVRQMQERIGAGSP